MVRAANERSSLFYVGGAFWLTACVLLTIWDFGVIAFCGSICMAIYAFGLREKFSNDETASAYSVFNRDGQAIVGGLTAEQFDRQLRGGGTGTGGGQNKDPVRGSLAVAETAGTNQTKMSSMSEGDRLRRRKAAAAAADRRFQSQSQAI